MLIYISYHWCEIVSHHSHVHILVFVFCYKNCVGQSLAMAMSYGIIARICSEYELILETEGCYEYSLTVKPVGFMLHFRKWA